MNRPGPGPGAERAGDGEQLVVVAHLAGQRGVAGPDVADDLVGREAERAESQPVGHELARSRAISSAVATRVHAASGPITAARTGR